MATTLNLHTEAGDKINGTTWHTRQAMLAAVRAEYGDCDITGEGFITTDSGILVATYGNGDEVPLLDLDDMTREQAIEIAGLDKVVAVEQANAEYTQSQGKAEDGHYFSASVSLPDHDEYYTLTVHYQPIADEDMPEDGDLGSCDWKISHYSIA